MRLNLLCALILYKHGIYFFVDKSFQGLNDAWLSCLNKVEDVDDIFLKYAES